MAHDDRHPTDPAPESPARAATGVLCLVLFVGAFVLLMLGFDADGAAAALLVSAGIVAFSLAYAVPTTILPALEARERR